MVSMRRIEKIICFVRYRRYHIEIYYLYFEWLLELVFLFFIFSPYNNGFIVWKRIFIKADQV